MGDFAKKELPRHYADLHVHSRHSRATSPSTNPRTMREAALRKGLSLVGTGDLTHPAWLSELKESLELSPETGFYFQKDAPGGEKGPFFVPTGEVSCIYKQDGKTRKIHLVLLSFDLEGAERIGKALGARGNVTSDGRPILGLSARDVLEITLTADPEAIVIPAHVWTPWFSLFGSMSGFDEVSECFKDLTPRVKALETGLSSDPAMNRLVSRLDEYLLVSSSDAHGPDNLGREATVIGGELSRQTLKSALTTGEGLLGTVEFFPEEGKYHLDGHASCGPALTPAETKKLKGICPVCGKRLTTGVLSRVMELADRTVPPPGLLLPDWHIFPLKELLGQVLGKGPDTKTVNEARAKVIRAFGSEYEFLLDAPLDEIEDFGGALLRLAAERTRKGEVKTRGGYDGVFGTVEAVTREDREADLGRNSLFSDEGGKRTGRSFPPRAPRPLFEKDPEKPPAGPAPAPGARGGGQKTPPPGPQER
ncbi:MAG: endonuclease Q family protein, partial [Deltaproteobacteria bacterium]|nr:endonuclease Q family protein [Deltaproteobacteria bacterium]